MEDDGETKLPNNRIGLTLTEIQYDLPFSSFTACKFKHPNIFAYNKYSRFKMIRII